MHSGLNHWSLVAVISHRGRAQRLLGAASERFAVRLVTDEPVDAVASRLKEPGHNEGKVAMSTARAASCTESQGVCGICLGRNDGCADQVCEVEITAPLRLPLRVITRHLPPGELLIGQREEMPTRHTTLRPNRTSVAFAEESRAANDRRGCSQVSVDSTASQYCPRLLGSNRPGPSRISSGAAFHSSTRNRGAAHLRFKLLRDLVKMCPGWKFED
jgi:hypothetical protein